MIITTWGAYILFRRASRTPFPADDAPADNIVEPEIEYVLEHWLKKIEEDAVKIFRQKSENRSDCQVEGIRTFPSIDLDLAAARSKPETWETFEDRRPPRDCSSTILSSSSSLDLTDDRTRIQFVRWSHTRVYHVTSDMRKDAMQERLDKVSNSVSRVMFQAVTDLDSGPSDTNLHFSMPAF
ncbi:spermatogenesis-associated protein 19, mitochondrial [Podarcis muralis]|uniref:spermatogenesis-associated protein 19, mitochondrial n=1 Tax=Podarcis muralis TaxID=64176 RepID=UPI00109F6348|nr:spermatogenesis-associated protein 19, mitochondrial [Podarcis muralis]